MGAGPLLCLDVDGVINLFETPSGSPPVNVEFELIDGVPYAIVVGVRDRLDRLGRIGELVWATGWGSRANERLTPALGLNSLRTVRFSTPGTRSNAFWKTEAIADFAGDRPLAWLDDSFDDRCRAWATERDRAGLSTLLVSVDPEVGLGDDDVSLVSRWAHSVDIHHGSPPEDP